LNKRIGMEHPSHQPFRFLDLPKELRLLVYERLPPRVVRTEYIRNPADDTPGTGFTLISTFPSKAILATCKLIKEEAESILRSVPERVPHCPVEGDLDAELVGPGVRIEACLNSLKFLGVQSGVIDAVMQWFQVLHQECTEGNIPRFEAARYLSISVFGTRGYCMKNGSLVQGILMARDFVWKAGWALYHRSQHRSLQEFQDAGCTPNKRSVSCGPTVQIALMQRALHTPSDYYGEVTEFSDLIERLESTFGLGFLFHLLNENDRTEEKSKETWTAVTFAISDLLHGGEMVGGTHGFLKEGVFGLDRSRNAVYKKYWCEGEWPESIPGPRFNASS
jgi:hypothetical protein